MAARRVLATTPLLVQMLDLGIVFGPKLLQALWHIKAELA